MLVHKFEFNIDVSQQYILLNLNYSCFTTIYFAKFELLMFHKQEYNIMGEKKK